MIRKKCLKQSPWARMGVGGCGNQKQKAEKLVCKGHWLEEVSHVEPVGEGAIIFEIPERLRHTVGRKRQGG